MSLNIIGDVAGRWHELQALKKKMPIGKFLYVGDLNDRGRHSKTVIEHVMSDPNATCLASNHGMMLAACYNLVNGTSLPCGFYNRDDLYNPKNGCLETVRSYGGWNNIPEEHAKWMVTRPWYYRDETLFVSHAPWRYNLTLEQACDIESGWSLIWNRNIDEYTRFELLLPERDQFQIYGHNGHFKEHRNADGKLYAMCIDDSRNNKLMGVHWPTLEVFEQEYLTYN